MSHFGFRRRHLVSDCALCLYSVTTSACGDSHFRNTLPPTIFYTDSTQSSGCPIQRFSGSNRTKEPFQRCHASSTVQFHSSCSAKSQTPISPWCTTVFQKQSLAGCRVKAMKSKSCCNWLLQKKRRLDGWVMNEEARPCCCCDNLPLAKSCQSVEAVLVHDHHDCVGHLASGKADVSFLNTELGTAFPLTKI
ncbi:uncharacterized [Lates japonicus]